MPLQTRATDHAASTEQLLLRAQAGDGAAVEALYARYLPQLRRWAAGRLPAYARDLADTHDMVQETLFHSVHHLQEFEHRADGAFLAYLRHAVLNRIRNELRRVLRRPAPGSLAENHLAPGPSPLDELLGRETLARYKRGLGQLTASDRQAIILRIECEGRYEAIAQALGKSNAAAARKALERALRRLASAMAHTR
jgi:RNA polymerase sigma-70 factor (ECF subfamily)